MDLFFQTQCLPMIVGHEGGYVNNPADPGGETNHGVTVSVARKNGYTGPMKDMTQDQASDILEREYYIKPGFDRIAALSNRLAIKLFDEGVNAGPSVPIQHLQHMLNLLNDGGKYYPDIAVDGVIGPGTINAFKAYIQKRGDEGELVLLTGVLCLMGAFYINITDKKPQFEAFIYGWLRERIM